MTNKAIEAWAWVLLYGGLLLGVLGLFVQRAGSAAGLVMMLAGGVAAAAGAGFIVWRARRPDPHDTRTTPSR